MAASIRIFKNVIDLADFFTEKLAGLVDMTPPGKYYSMALSGGTTPGSVFSFLASNNKIGIDWNKVQIFWGDERCVDPDDEQSNYRMARESLLDKIHIPDDNIFRIRGEKVPGLEVVRYAETVRRNVGSLNNVPRFDMMMLGLGEDGHTASIFPGNMELFSTEKLFEATENPYTKQKRITATGRIINQAKTIVFVVNGIAKASMVARIIDKQAGWEKLPASLVNPGSGELFWLLDEKAASQLSDRHH